MGIFNSAVGINVETATKDLEPLLVDGEIVEHAFKLTRDQIIFTNKRVITIDKQGLTGSKQNIRTVPYKSIKMISKQGSGILSSDAELLLYVTGESEALKFEFLKSADINAVYKLIAAHIL